MTLHGANAQTLAFTHDANKNTDSLIAADGSLVGHYAYGPFGQVIATTGSLASANFYRFSSEFEDGECGVVYYNWRYFMPTTGRWASRDPLAEAGGVSLYCSNENDLLCKVDVLGLNPLIALLCDCAKEGVKTEIFAEIERKLNLKKFSQALFEEVVMKGNRKFIKDSTVPVGVYDAALYFGTNTYVWPSNDVKVDDRFSEVLRGCMYDFAMKKVKQNKRIPLDAMEQKLVDTLGQKAVDALKSKDSSGSIPLLQGFSYRNSVRLRTERSESGACTHWFELEVRIQMNTTEKEGIVDIGVINNSSMKRETLPCHTDQKQHQMIYDYLNGYKLK